MQQADPFLGTLHRWMEVFMQRSMREFVRYTRESGFSLSQLGALFQLRRRGSCGVGDLGESLGVTASAASQLLDRLVQQGLIQRSENPSDRRVKQIALTAKGHELLLGGIRARESWLSDLETTLSDSEKESVVAALNILIDRAIRLGQPADPETESHREGTSHV
jgi:DNA-binding MarR family transcriptional regulator